MGSCVFYFPIEILQGTLLLGSMCLASGSFGVRASRHAKEVLSMPRHRFHLLWVYLNWVQTIVAYRLGLNLSFLQCFPDKCDWVCYLSNTDMSKYVCFQIPDTKSEISKCLLYPLATYTHTHTFISNLRNPGSYCTFLKWGYPGTIQNE